MAIDFRYTESGEAILVGDVVRIRRLLLPDRIGVVDYVYDPSKPSIPKGDNEIGFSVRVDEKRSIWANEPDRRIALVRRADEPESVGD